MNRVAIEQLIAVGESETLEFKLTTS